MKNHLESGARKAIQYIPYDLSLQKKPTGTKYLVQKYQGNKKW